jgi:hypothetical protein
VYLDRLAVPVRWKGLGFYSFLHFSRQVELHVLAYILLCDLLPPPGSVRVNHILFLAESMKPGKYLDYM